MRAHEQHVWSFAIRLLHWLTVVALAAQIVVAFWLMGSPGMATPRWLPLHMSLGTAIVGITLVRIVWRMFERAPKLSELRWVRRLSCLAHASLYGLLLAVSLTGWFAYRPAPLMPAVRLFGAWPVPLFRGFQAVSFREIAAIHRSLVWILLGLIAVHMAAALWHALVLRDGVWRGMTSRPIAAENAEPEAR